MVILVTPWITKLAIRCGAVDDPTRDERRVHKEPIPRWGGIGIYIGILASLAIMIPLALPETLFPSYLIGIIVLGGIIVVLGALDDLFSYSAKVQILYLVAAGVAIQFCTDAWGQIQIKGITWPPFTDGTWLGFPWWAALLVTAFYIFFITKTMDTIDGVDGLAAGIAGISGAALAIIAASEAGGQPRVAIVAAAVSGAAFGFLRHNYNPAKVFMGTGGAQVLGFMLACLSIVGALKTAATAAIFIPLLVFGVPLFDALFVMARRAWNRESLTKADKRHVHHTLLSSGLNQRQTVWVLYGVAVVLSAALVWLVVRRGG